MERGHTWEHRGTEQDREQQRDFLADWVVKMEREIRTRMVSSWKEIEEHRVGEREGERQPQSESESGRAREREAGTIVAVVSWLNQAQSDTETGGMGQLLAHV